MTPLAVRWERGREWVGRGMSGSCAAAGNEEIGGVGWVIAVPARDN